MTAELYIRVFPSMFVIAVILILLYLCLKCFLRSGGNHVESTGEVFNLHSALTRHSVFWFAVCSRNPGTVNRVLDGDTIEILHDNKPVRVRLANIDAPEKKQAFGRWSTNQLKGLVAAQPVTVTYTQTDRYGRIIGRVFTTNGIEANQFMVISGAAWVYERYNTDDELPALQLEAQKMKRGLWADSQPLPPWEWRHNK